MTHPFILASSSPRRRHLLRMAGYDPDIAPAAVDETPVAGEPPAVYVTRLAKAKASTSAQAGAVTLGSDTTVVCGGQIYGKPGSVDGAIEMLRALSGRTHTVFSGVAVVGPDGMITCNTVATDVEFAPIGDEVINAYAGTGATLDKAGSYGIQDFGATFVRAIRGSYTNVVGLPLAETIDMLTVAGLQRPLPVAGPEPGASRRMTTRD